jgi:membrane protease YdiL (CAAX protease family)
MDNRVMTGGSMINSPLRTWIKEHPLLSFFALSYAIAWTVWILIGILTPALLTTLSLVGAWAPTLSAVILTGVISGKAGIHELLRRGLHWRVGIQWYAIVLFSIALIGIAAIALHVSLGGTVPKSAFPARIPANQLYVFLPIIYLSNIFLGSPIAEEFGWRGFALPKLQARIGALSAALVIGVLWGLWHLPFFIFPEGAAVIGYIPFVWYLPLVTAWSVLFAWIFNNTKGSVLMMILFHAAINTTFGSLGLFQIKSEGVRPLVLIVILTWVVVATITVVFGPGQLARKHTLDA